MPAVTNRAVGEDDALRRAARPARIVVAVLLVPALVSTANLSGTSEHHRWPEWTAAFKVYAVGAPVLVGLAWWSRRPRSRIGPVLVAFGFSAWPMAWLDASSPLVHSVGKLGEGAYMIVLVYLLLAYPAGRLPGIVEKALWYGMVFITAAYFAVLMLFSPVVRGSGVLSRCIPACPENPLMVRPEPELMDILRPWHVYPSLGVAAAILVIYVARMRAASRPRRRAIAAVAASSLLYLPAFIVYQFSWFTLDLDGETLDQLAWLSAAGRVLLPLGFLVALVQAEVFARSALRRLMAELTARPSPQRWRAAVAAALDDPELELLVRDPERGVLVDARGHDVHAGWPGDRSDGRARGRLHVAVEREGAHIGYLVADPALADDPELLGAAAEATAVAIEIGTWDGELRASLRRAIEASDRERRRIERDLHDSAQQRLLSLRFQLDRVGATDDDPDVRQQLVADLSRQLDETIDDVRTIARGAFPPALTTHGAAAALRASVRNGSPAVRVAGDLPRLSQAMERTVYFCCLEAVQNAHKHAGSDARITIRLTPTEHGVRFEVADDGCGFDPQAVTPGTGLGGMADRAHALGGVLSVASAPGRGTSVVGWLPGGSDGGEPPGASGGAPV